MNLRLLFLEQIVLPVDLLSHSDRRSDPDPRWRDHAPPITCIAESEVEFLVHRTFSTTTVGSEPVRPRSRYVSRTRGLVLQTIETPVALCSRYGPCSSTVGAEGAGMGP